MKHLMYRSVSNRSSRPKSSDKLSSSESFLTSANAKY